jgi:limonene-1,2-epoxide hydrolase
VATTHEDVLRAVFDGWEGGIEAGQAAMRAHLTDDCRWEQTGLPTTTGAEEAAQFFGSMEAMGFARMQVEVHHVGVAGDLAFSERTDWLVRPDGSRVGPWPVVGVMEFRDGKISAWREYFDGRNLEMLAGS